MRDIQKDKALCAAAQSVTADEIYNEADLLTLDSLLNMVREALPWYIAELEQTGEENAAKEWREVAEILSRALGGGSSG